MKDLWTKKTEKEERKSIRLHQTLHCNFCDFSCNGPEELIMKDHMEIHLVKKTYLFDNFSLHQFFDIDCLYKWCRLKGILVPKEDNLNWVVEQDFNRIDDYDEPYFFFTIDQAKEIIKDNLNELNKANKMLEKLEDK